MVDLKENIKNWLTSGTDKKEDVLDMVWTIKEEDNLIIAEHPKVPFVLYIYFEEKSVKLIVDTEVDTALLEQVERLDIYRKLLILNDRVNMIKFAITGEDEELVLKVELDSRTLDKDEFRDALTGIIGSLYLMVKELNMEEEFNKMVSERIMSMVQEKLNEGASASDLLVFLTKKVGLDKENAQKIIDSMIKKNEYSEGYQ